MPDATAIQGLWAPTKAQLAGEYAPPEVLQRTEFELTADRYTVRFAGEASDEGTYTLRATDPLKSLLLRSTAGTNLGRTIPCIYQLAGDRLRICFGLDGVAPTAFTAAAGTTHYLVTYYRQHP